MKRKQFFKTISALAVGVFVTRKPKGVKAQQISDCLPSPELVSLRGMRKRLCSRFNVVADENNEQVKAYLTLINLWKNEWDTDYGPQGFIDPKSIEGKIKYNSDEKVHEIEVYFDVENFVEPKKPSEAPFWELNEAQMKERLEGIGLNNEEIEERLGSIKLKEA